jgi:hypothetical protein
VVLVLVGATGAGSVVVVVVVVGGVVVVVPLEVGGLLVLVGALVRVRLVDGARLVLLGVAARGLDGGAYVRSRPSGVVLSGCARVSVPDRVPRLPGAVVLETAPPTPEVPLVRTSVGSAVGRPAPACAAGAPGVGSPAQGTDPIATANAGTPIRTAVATPPTTG